MKFYRAKWKDDEPSHGNCSWHTRRRDAEKAIRDTYYGVVEEWHVPTDREGMLEFLTEYLWRATPGQRPPARVDKEGKS